MQFKVFFSIIMVISSIISYAQPAIDHQVRRFDKIMIIVFENMSYPEIQHAPIFRKLINYAGYDLDEEAHLTHFIKNKQVQHSNNGYALFSSYYNNHSGGDVHTRPSQPNYLAMTSGSTHGMIDNNIHDLNVDNLASELIDAGISWKVYAEDLPELQTAQAFPAITRLGKLYNHRTSHGCFVGATFPSDDGYKRKHEPFINYINIQRNDQFCKNIVNSIHLNEDLHAMMPDVSFYIPNQINDGHNGSLSQRIARANAFLSKMMGADAATGELLPNYADAPLQKFMSQGGFVVITFDEPSAGADASHANLSMYMLLAGKMINSGAYPNPLGENSPVCYPPVSEQIKYPHDSHGPYNKFHCNHYNLLRMIETNYGLRGLHSKNTSTGYQYAYSLDKNVPGLWKINKNSQS